MAKSKEKKDSMSILVDSSIALQKTITEMALGMNKLTKEVAVMVDLFKEAGKAVAERKELPSDEELKKKVDAVLEQNKIIAKGLLLLESQISGRGARAARSSEKASEEEKFDGFRKKELTDLSDLTDSEYGI